MLRILLPADVAAAHATVNGFRRFLRQVVSALVSAAVAGVAAVVAVTVAVCGSHVGSRDVCVVISTVVAVEALALGGKRIHVLLITAVVVVVGVAIVLVMMIRMLVITVTFVAAAALAAAGSSRDTGHHDDVGMKGTTRMVRLSFRGGVLVLGVGCADFHHHHRGQALGLVDIILFY